MKRKNTIVLLSILVCLLAFSSCNFSRFSKMYYGKIEDNIDYNKDGDYSYDYNKDDDYSYDYNKDDDYSYDYNEDGVYNYDHNKAGDYKHNEDYNPEEFFLTDAEYEKIEVFSHIDNKVIAAFMEKEDIATILFNIEYDSWEFGMTTKNPTPLYTLTFYKFDTDPALAESAYENFSLIIYKGSNVVKIVFPEKTAAIMGLPKSLSEYTFKVTNSKLHKVIELIEKQTE